MLQLHAIRSYKEHQTHAFAFHCSWNETLMLFAASFYITWLFFATIYYVICYVHGDLEPGLMNVQNETHTVCVLEIENFGKYIAIALMMIFLKQDQRNL